jgi:hypothetical protein
MKHFAINLKKNVWVNSIVKGILDFLVYAKDIGECRVNRTFSSDYNSLQETRRKKE